MWQSMVAGAAGGVCETLVGFPFDTLKVRVQSGVRTGMFNGLYSGVGSRLCGVVPDWCALYVGFTIGKRLDYPEWVPSWARSFTAGCFAGVVGGLVICPFDAVKIRAQTQPEIGTWGAARSLGFRGLWAGLPATMIWSVPSQGVFWMAHDVSVDAMKDDRLGERWQKMSPLVMPFVAGGVAGIAEWLVALPLDTIKTRIQAGKAEGFQAAAVEIMRRQGVTGFYRGFGWVMARAIPANGAAVCGIHIVERTLSGQDHRIAP